MSSSYGEDLRLTIFGQSHSPAIGMSLEGVPAGEKIDLEELSAFLRRRAPGQSLLSTQRREADEPEFLSGIKEGFSCGAPIAAIIRNSDSRSQDYSQFKAHPRPGHADYCAQVKYGGFQDQAGGGHFSGRLTAPLCIAGGLCLQFLKAKGISVISRIKSIGDIEDGAELCSSTAHKSFPVVDDAVGEKMQQAILEARSQGDSLGGIIECQALGLPAGLGDPIFGGMENRIAAIVFGIPAVKGIEFGLGFASARLRGSQNNDPFIIKDGKPCTAGNNCGGILGGITNSMPLVFRVAIKPTPSIALEQDSIDLETMSACKLRIGGRHDPCIVPRAVPVVEAACAIALYDALLGRRKELCP